MIKIDNFEDYEYIGADLTRLCSVLACAEPITDDIIVDTIAGRTNERGDVVEIGEEYANTLGLVSGIRVEKNFWFTENSSVKTDHPLYAHGTFWIDGKAYIFRTERLQDDIQDLIDAIDMLQTVRELRRH